MLAIRLGIRYAKMKKKLLKYALWALAILLVFAAGSGLTLRYMSQPRSFTEKESTILLERVKAVAKLVSVEGYFSEIYTYDNHWEPLPNPLFSPKFSKRLITVVKAKVSVGYDLEKLHLEADHSQKVLRISNIPKPEIISLEHDLEYYDVQVSTFNKFTREEMNVINADAKEFIRRKALESELLERAEEEGNRMLEIITFMAEESGWTVEYSFDFRDLIPSYLPEITNPKN